MNNKAIINLLKNRIFDTLRPIIGRRTILTDLPYHGNIGDILIWEGELTFLKDIGSYPIYQTSGSTFTFPVLDEDITICLHGGGNFGDLYRGAQDFRLSVVNAYPNNRIVIFPQSVWYSDKELVVKDAVELGKHPDLYICARDITGYEFMKQKFTNNNILLVPDMAFCIGDLSNNKILDKDDNALFIKRLDKEYDNTISRIDMPYCTRDWPAFEKKLTAIRIFVGINHRLQRFGNKTIFKCTDWIMGKYFRQNLIAKGISILSPYTKIYTTRLHALILGILLDKDIVVFDNSTKKLSDFVNSWLMDDDNVTFG